MNCPFSPTPPESSLIALICRCSSPQVHADRAMDSALDSARSSEEAANKKVAAAEIEYQKRLADLARRTPVPDRFEVEDAVEVGAHLVMKVVYPNCASCAFEGSKVMVFLNTKVTVAIKWRRIDPHFRPATLADTGRGLGIKEAPSPAARFPATKDGWIDAIAYARGKS